MKSALQPFHAAPRSSYWDVYDFTVVPPVAVGPSCAFLSRRAARRVARIMNTQTGYIIISAPSVPVKAVEQ